jgi:hypothetical protein
MVNTVRELLAHQYEAALCMLNRCIDLCPDAAWNAPVANLAFCQVAFHTLFFTDVYLGADEESVRDQPFHHDRPAFFRDYEELLPRRQQHLYDRPAIREYLDYCRQKAADVVAAETAESLTSGHGFPRRPPTRAELHVYNIRHIQHHAAQLSLRLRLDSGMDVPWVGWGWRTFGPSP